MFLLSAYTLFVLALLFRCATLSILAVDKETIKVALIHHGLEHIFIHGLTHSFLKSCVGVKRGSGTKPSQPFSPTVT